MSKLMYITECNQSNVISFTCYLLLKYETKIVEKTCEKLFYEIKIINYLIFFV